MWYNGYMRKVRGKIRNFVAECKTAALGVLLAYKRPHFVIAVVASFIIFGTLMSLLSAGTAGIGLMFSGSVGTLFNVLWKAFLGLFGVGREFADWIFIFSISVLQATVIGLVAFVWKNRTQKYKEAVSSNADNVERAGIAAGLAVLGSGCPTCGTTLLMPVITAVVGGGSMALASAISGILTVLAVVVLLFSMKSLGREAYTLIIEQELTKKEKK